VGFSPRTNRSRDVVPKIIPTITSYVSVEELEFSNSFVVFQAS